MGERRTIDWFEWARAIGALAIVALHSVRTTELASGLAVAHPTLFWWEGLLQIPLARWCVPVFLMISGALLLDPSREMGLRKVGRYVWRMAFILLTIGLLFCVMEQVATLAKETGSFRIGPGAWPGVLGRSLLNLLEGDSWDHLWYLYALIGLYLLTPVLRPFVAGASRRELATVILVGWAVVCLVPAANLVLGTSLYRFVALDSSVIYYLAGYYAYNYLRLDRRIAAAGLASLALACLPSVAAAAVSAGDPLATSGLAVGIAAASGTIALPAYGVVLPFSLLVFLAFRRWLDCPVVEHPVVRALARDSFGIYLLHPLFGHLAVWFLDYRSVPVALLQLGIFFAGVVGSAAITRLLRLVPGFRGKL